jgi:ribosomal protein S18 acetylase RimI-like enzyme
VTFRLRAKTRADDRALAEVWAETHAGSTIISRGRALDALALPGLVAEEDGKVVGAVTWHRDGDALEVVTLDRFVENRGVGTALLAAAVEEARRSGVHRAWLITSNDNMRAIRFYQRRGWNLVALHRDAIMQARKLKPDIPMLGNEDIPIRHEVEFELVL